MHFTLFQYKTNSLADRYFGNCVIPIIMISLVRKNHEIALLSNQLHLIFLFSDIPSSCPEASSNLVLPGHSERETKWCSHAWHRGWTVDPRCVRCVDLIGWNRKAGVLSVMWSLSAQLVSLPYICWRAFWKNIAVFEEMASEGKTSFLINSKYCTGIKCSRKWNYRNNFCPVRATKRCLKITLSDFKTLTDRGHVSYKLLLQATGLSRSLCFFAKTLLLKYISSLVYGSVWRSSSSNRNGLWIEVDVQTEMCGLSKERTQVFRLVVSCRRIQKEKVVGTDCFPVLW